MTIECVQGDITQQPDIDAIVNAANAQLRPGGGVAGAIGTVRDALQGPGRIERVRFVLFDEEARALHQKVLDDLASA